MRGHHDFSRDSVVHHQRCARRSRKQKEASLVRTLLGGSSVFSRSEGEVEVHLGALDEVGVFVPDYELWTERREPWLPVFPGMTGYARDR